MKIKYKMPNKNHPTHILIGNMTQKQVGSIIAFLDNQNIDFEYIG